MRASPHYPVYVTPHPSVPGGCVYNGSADFTQRLPINGEGVIEYENDVFVGRLLVHVRGLETTDPSVFAGKRRAFHVAAQGRFKRPYRVAAMCAGQEFEAPIRGYGRAVEFACEQILRACAKVFSKTTIVDAHGERPFFLNPLVAAAQVINVARPGEEPDIWAAEEDCRLLSPALAGPGGAPVPADRRRKWADDPANVEGLWYDPDLVYTVHVWQHVSPLLEDALFAYMLAMGGGEGAKDGRRTGSGMHTHTHHNN